MRFMAILICCLFYLTGTSAQSTDDIIRKHIEAVGGDHNWAKIKTIVIKSQSEDNGNFLYLKKSARRDSCIRSDIRVQSKIAGRNDKLYYILINRKEGWKYLPEDRNNTIYTLYASEIEEYRDELDYEDPFIRYQDKGRDIQLVGLEYYHHKEYYKFMIKYKSGKKVNCYLNSTTLMIDLIEATDTQTENLQRFLDYETLSEGIVIAKRIIGPGGEKTISSVTINHPLEESVFKPSERNRYTLRN